MPFKTIRIRSVLAPLLLLASVVSVAFAAADSRPPLRVGIKEAPPLILRGGDGKWHGPAVTLWERIAETNQLEFAYEEYDLEGLLAAV